MLFVGIDWAEERHRVILMDAHGTVLEHTSVTHDQPGLSHLDWLLTHDQQLTEVHVAIELHDSLLLDRLLRLGVKVYGLNPRSAERVRERFTPAGLNPPRRTTSATPGAWPSSCGPATSTCGPCGPTATPSGPCASGSRCARI